MFRLILNSGKHNLGLIKLPSHTGLREIHEVPWIMHNHAIDDAITQPRVLPQGPRLAIVLSPVMGNIQMDLICQALNLPLWAYAFVVNKNQINIRRPTQQRISGKQ
jgi:hypothetical protein